MTRASEELLGELHALLARELIARIKSGTATAADFGAARQFLKDNGIEALPADPAGGLALLQEALLAADLGDTPN